MVRNVCNRALRWKCTTPRQALPAVASALLPLKAMAPILPANRKTKSRESKADESVSAIYSAAYCDFVVDGRDAPGWSRSVPAASGFRASTGGLPDDPGADVLSGCESLCNGVLGHHATRAAIRPGARAQSDDLDQLFRCVSNHAAICA